MEYYFPFGQKLKSLVQKDRSPKKVFVLGVYASAVHARWENNGKIVCQALAVASEPEIFWDGNINEAQKIISSINIPKELGTLKPAGKNLNGPSAKVLDKNILLPLGFSRKDAWLCDCLPETRINSSQAKVIDKIYNPLKNKYNLNSVTIPLRPTLFCDEKRSQEITREFFESKADLLILLGDIPICQYLKRVADIKFSSLDEYCDLYGYGNQSEVVINEKVVKVLPLAHPRQIGALGLHSEKWFLKHKEWENNISKIK